MSLLSSNSWRVEGPPEGDQALQEAHHDWLWHQLPRRCGGKNNLYNKLLFTLILCINMKM